MIDVGVYIHIPFCTTICPYCSFYKMPAEKVAQDAFCQALLTELTHYDPWASDIRISSIYFGGGTPNTMNIAAIKMILQAIKDRFEWQDSIEICLEMNPDLCDEAYLEKLFEMGVNRLSFGVQSSHAEELKFLGRSHTFKDVQNLQKILKKQSFDHYNFDLIYGCPGSTLETVAETLNAYLACDPPHISTYSLTIVKGTEFARRGIQSVGEDLEAEQYESIIQILTQNGYHQYELSAFSQAPDYECLHNRQYWRFRPYIGLGPSAWSYFNRVLYQQTRDMHAYLADPKKALQVRPDYPLESEKKDYMVANFRLIEGLNIADYHSRFNTSFFSEYGSAIQTTTELGLVKTNHHHVELTEKGRLLYDSVVAYFM